MKLEKVKSWSKVSEIHWQVLYHQLATDEIDEEVEERRRIFRPRIHHNSIMELSIHNRLIILENPILFSFFIISDGCSSSAWL